MEKILKSEYNKMIIENFILWYTHNNRVEALLPKGKEDTYSNEYRDQAKALYKALDIFIENNEVDGFEGNEFEVLLTTQDTDNELTEVIKLKQNTGEFISEDLAKDLEELFFDISDTEISKEFRGDLPYRFAIYIGEEAYWYFSEKERDADYKLLKTALVYSNFKFTN